MRTFVVGQTVQSNTLVRFFVTDASSDSIDDRPFVVEFPVSEAYPKECQLQRARDYCLYLNKLEEAMQVAYNQTNLLDMLAR